MRVEVTILGLLVLAACAHAPTNVDFAVRNVTIIDGTGRPSYVGDVFVDDRRIVAAGARGEISLTSDDTIDGTGRFLIPGLIDMHAHVASFTPHPEGLDALLAAGITTARDMGGDLATLQSWREEVAHGERQGPELIMVGATLSGGEAAPFHRIVARPGDADAAVAEMAQAGAAEIKVHNALSPNVLSAVIDAARTRGLDVVGHISAGPGPLSACRMGMKEISHASALLESVPWRADAPPADLVAALEELNSLQSDPLYACMAANGMAFAPNLSMYEPIIADLDESQAGMTRRLVNVLGQISLRAKNAGVLIIAASDASGDDGRVQFATGLHDELRLLVEAGFTPTEALMAATHNAAVQLRREGDIGAIQVGAQADLVLLCADPLADISNTRAIGLVIANGRRTTAMVDCPARR